MPVKPFAPYDGPYDGLLLLRSGEGGVLSLATHQWQQAPVEVWMTDSNGISKPLREATAADFMPGHSYRAFI